MGQFEREYRKALDGLRFSGEGKERIMNNLMEQEMERPVKGKRLRPMRAALIAAALCLALVGTAFAVTELSRMRVNWGDSGISTDGYSVEYAVDFYPLNAFSQELRGLAAAHPGRQYIPMDEELAHRYFNTWGEAHEYIGLTLFQNPVLDGAEPGPTGTAPWEYHRGSQDPDKTHLMLLASVTEDGELDAVQTNSSHLVDGIWVRVAEVVYTQRAEGTLYYTVEGTYTAEERVKKVGDGRHARAGLVYGEGYEVTQENYTTPNGLDALIIQSIRPEPRKSTLCAAYFLIDGALLQVTAGSDGPNCELTQPEPDQAMAVLKQVLDGFTK